MKSPNHGHVIGIPVSSVTYAAEELPSEPASVTEPASLNPQSDSYGSTYCKQNKKDSIVDWMSKISKGADNYMQGIREHVTLGPKISETMKGKLSLGARILRAGGMQRVFRQAFSVEKGEKLLKAFQCYLSTTAGPIVGMLFISTEKIAFHSDRSLALTSSKADLVRVPYKVLIPLRRIKKAISSANLDKPNQKYIQILTIDDFEFWFMGFIRYQRSFRYLKKAISELQ
ncbi:GEM-like protein 4 [Cocos nucifera]|uniref:GEM-like protein 4 n=1 Tax=Cocos nucifera TaxID=13894 RepID=A0A8K0IGR2_COCNU|nr:GEM-like protein 4 [Cocos nucifera]